MVMPFNAEELKAKLIEEALQLCKEFMEIHPYECFCGSGITTPTNCTWHLAFGKAEDALRKLGFTFKWDKK